MAIKIGGVTVINDSRGLENITDGLSPEVKTPEITFPTNGASGFSAIDAPNIKITAPYYSLYDFAKKGTEVQIDNNSDFSSPLVNADETGTDTTFLYDNTTYSFATSTTYYARVRHYDINDVYSEWSSTISFTTPSTFSFISTPSITSPTTGAIDQGSAVSITSDAFAVTPGGADTHVSSDWQIATNAGFTNIVDQSIADTSNKTSYTVSGLSTSTTYYVRVRYNGNTLTSSYSSTISFTTSATFATYAIVASSALDKFGDSYQHFITHAEIGGGDRSFFVAGRGGSTAKILRYDKDLNAQAYFNYSTRQDYWGGMATFGTNDNYLLVGAYDSSNKPAMTLFSTANNTITYANSWTITGGSAPYWISDIRKKPQHLVGSGTQDHVVWCGFTSNYEGYAGTWDENGIGNSVRIVVSGASYFLTRGMAYLSDGKVALASTYRNSSNQNYLNLTIFTDNTFSNVYICHNLLGPYSDGNNANVIELRDGRLIVSDWDVACAVDISTSTPVVDAIFRPNRSDMILEASNGELIAINSQSDPTIQAFDSDFNTIDANHTVRLDYSTTNEYQDSYYIPQEDAILSAGRYYTGSAYRGLMTKIPGDITNLPINSPFPNLTQFKWLNMGSYDLETSNVPNASVQQLSHTLYNLNGYGASSYSGGGGSTGVLTNSGYSLYE
jgi:hypothetical protein